MKITNICPYCGQEMQEGALPAYKYQIKWCPSNAHGGIIEGEGVRLSKEPVFAGVYATAGYCESCGVVIVPVPDQEEVKSGLSKAFEKLGRRLDEWDERQEEKEKAREQEREREKREKEREARRRKDPWEV